MINTSSDIPATSLRERFVEDMNVRRLSLATQHNYLRDVPRFANWLGRPPDQATDEDLRRYQIEQSETGLGAPAMNMAVSALRFFYTRTLGRPDLTRKLHRVKHPRSLPTVRCPHCSAATRSCGCSMHDEHQASGDPLGRLRSRSSRVGSDQAQGPRRRQRAHVAPRPVRQGRPAP
jgi:hypothetical protein